MGRLVNSSDYQLQGVKYVVVKECAVEKLAECHYE